MSSLQVFKNNEFGELKAVIKKKQPLFLANPLAKILNYSEPAKMLKRLDSDEKVEIKSNEVATVLGVSFSELGLSKYSPKAVFITESGLYNAILGSEKQEAKKFKRWVTNEVLPSIRKYGTYMTDDVIEKALTSPDFLIQLATNLKKEKQKRVLAEQKIEEQKPLVNFANKVSVSKNSLLVREVAKIASKKEMKIGEKRLWNKLREWNLILKNSTEPKQYGIDRGYFEIVEGTRESSKGTFSYKTTRVTGKGQVYIISRLQKELSQQEVACTE
ncbi:hypothetical protein Z959_08540 [Clostridium novyi B str. ATCC 27606]|uniref:Bro-N domain-containing protein n=1 Tax=Clostridium novyi B str. ATCC 27606 TaxID=1443123 RepID=A0AA40IV08_CLONO|nr:phage antirepressor KilAC domain-containing protein [Clostridium novyi]KEI16867.1 hypothetical protein Z959_08540 [Clostridium novyi B str. ATCC 27606]